MPVSSGNGTVRQLHAPGRPTGFPPPPRRRVLVPVNDNRPPLPVRLRRPFFLALLTAAVVAAAFWLI
jgi:hypothetical protein